MRRFLIIALVAAAAVYFIQKPKAAWDPANVVPKNAVFTVGVDLTSTSQKKQALRIVQEISKESGIDSNLAELAKRFKEQTGLDLTKDILPLTNMRAVLAMLDQPSEGSPQFLLAIGARNPKSARELQGRIVKASTSRGKAPETVRIGKVDFARIKDKWGHTFIGIVEDAVVIANSRGAAEASAAMRGGRDSLAASAEYKTAAEPDPSTVAYMYIAGEALGNFGSKVTAKSAVVGRGLRTLGDQFDCGTAKLRASGDGITFEGTWKTTGDSAVDFGRGAAGELAGIEALAPAESGVFLGIGAWDSLWNQLEKMIQSDPSAKRRMESFRSSAKRTVGFDPVEDVAACVRSAGLIYVPSQPGGFLLPGQAVLMIKPNDEARMEAHLKKVRSGMAKLMHTSVATTKSGDSTINYTMGLPGMPQWSDSRMGDVFLVSIDRRMIEALVNRKGSGSATLQRSPRYRAARDMLPEGASAIAYVNVDPLFDAFGQAFPARERISKTLKRVGTAALGVSQDKPDSTRFVLAVPFNKE